MNARPVALTVLALAAGLSAAGCADVDPEDVVGEFSAVDAQGSVVLGADGTFTAEDVPVWAVGDEPLGERGEGLVDKDLADDVVDLTGTWDYPESSGRDFVSLTIHDIAGPDLEVRGVQLWVVDADTLFFRPNPDRAAAFAYERST